MLACVPVGRNLFARPTAKYWAPLVCILIPYRPHPQDIAQIEAAAHLAAIAIERARSQEALRISEERHRLLADHASDVIWTMSLEGRFTYVSPSVEKLRGYTVAEIMKQGIDEALTPESAAIAGKPPDGD